MAESTELDIRDKHCLETQTSSRPFVCWKCHADNSVLSYEVCPVCRWSHCSNCWACAPGCFGDFCETPEEYMAAAEEYTSASLESNFSKDKWFFEKVMLNNEYNAERERRRDEFFKAKAVRFRATQDEYERKCRFAIYEREKKAREAERIAKIEREEHIRQMHEFVPVGTVIFFPTRTDDEGTVVGYSFSEDGKSEYIHITVNGVEKRFVFPDAFDMNYLSLL